MFRFLPMSAIFEVLNSGVCNCGISSTHASALFVIEFKSKIPDFYLRFRDTSRVIE